MAISRLSTSRFERCYLRVVSLEVSPVDDGFMSASLDGTVRLWDLRTAHCRVRLGSNHPTHDVSSAIGFIEPSFPFDSPGGVRYLESGLCRDVQSTYGPFLFKTAAVSEVGRARNDPASQLDHHQLVPDGSLLSIE